MDWLGKYPEDPDAEVPRREQHAERAGPGGRPPLARLRGVPRSHRRALRRAARARRRALELLLRLRRVGDGRQRHRGSGRRAVPDRRRGEALQPARSVHRWALVPPSSVPTFFYVESPVSTKVRSRRAVDRRLVHRHPPRRAGRRRHRGQRPADPLVERHAPRSTARRSSTSSPTAARPTPVRSRSSIGIRTQWEAFFLQATESRMTANTRLR